MSGTPSASSLHRLSHALLLIGLLNLAAGCFAPELKTIPAPSKERFSEIKKSVATLRGLQPKPDFEIAALFLAISQLAANADYAGANGTLPLAQLERAYKQLGLLSAKDDFRTDLENFHRLKRLISHDSAKEQILIAAEYRQTEQRTTSALRPRATELPLAIGIVHALQQQHFQWQEKISGTFTDDTRLAYRAIAGGDVLLTALAYITDGNLAAPGHHTAARQIARQMEILARGLPTFLRNQLILPCARAATSSLGQLKPKAGMV